jgi:hypothetical protein
MCPSFLLIFLFIFISMYSLYKGYSLWQFQTTLYCIFFILYIGYIVHCTPPSLSHSLNPLLAHLLQLQEVSWFYFIYVYEAHQPYSLMFISSVYPFLFHPYLPMVPILQSCLSFLISKSLFIRFFYVSQLWMCWTLVTTPPGVLSLPSLSHNFLSPYLHRCNVLWYCWLSLILFSFPSFP